MPDTLTKKLIKAHLHEGSLRVGSSVQILFDQTLCQDATGTLVMLELEAMGLDRVKTKVSAQYVDHNLLQEDHKNSDDHLFLLSAAQRFGAWYSRPGNGISHPLHMQRFGQPGATLIGSDSHTCAAGCLGMFAIGAGGADVAMAMAGQPIEITVPEVWGVKLLGALPPWVSAKDVILEMLRRHGVNGGLNRVIEYYGRGVKSLSAMDRHVIANMGAELGATATVFPSDDETKRYLASEGRANDWQALAADVRCDYDHHDEINLSELQPLIAKPSSPGNVVPVVDVQGEDIYQSYIGSSANPGYRDFAVAADIVAGQTLPPQVSLDINPPTRQTLQLLIRDGHIGTLLAAGARLHQAGCNGCIGMGQAPASEKNSLRTTPRNFPGRSGTKEDRVWLCSPETAVASALKGKITDPRSVKINHPKRTSPNNTDVDLRLWVAPDDASNRAALVKGPNIKALPTFGALPDSLKLPVLLTLGDDISTDEILPAGAQVLPFRSNIEKISEFVFQSIDERYVESTKQVGDQDGHAIVAGHNYGQGSSREHAALAPRALGLRVVIAKSFARIHKQNLVNYGILPLTLTDQAVEINLSKGETLSFSDLKAQLKRGAPIYGSIENSNKKIDFDSDLSEREVDVLLAGGIINWLKKTA